MCKKKADAELISENFPKVYYELEKQEMMEEDLIDDEEYYDQNNNDDI